MLARKIVMNALYYSGLQAALNPLLAGKGSIMMLHHVCNVELTEFSPNYHLTVSPAFLDRLLTELSPHYEFVSMDEVHDRLTGKKPFGDKPFLAVTLDDGYIDNLENAVPMFRKYDVPFTIYVAPKMSYGKSTIWWEDTEACIRLMDNLNIELPSGMRHFDLSTAENKQQAYKIIMKSLFEEMGEEQFRDTIKEVCRIAGHDDVKHLKNHIADMSAVKEISKDPLCTIGAHSMGHYMLSKLNPEVLNWEMEQSKITLERELGQPVEHFAYPYGFAQASGPREFRAARNLGFKTAVTTRHGVLYAANAEHLHALPRVSINGHHQKMKYMNTLLSGIPTRLKNKGRKLDVA